MGPKVDGLMMKQPTFNWDMDDKYNELKNFRLGVNNVFKLYTMTNIEMAAKLKKWLGRKGLQLLQTLTQVEQETCETACHILKDISPKPKLTEAIPQPLLGQAHYMRLLSINITSSLGQSPFPTFHQSLLRYCTCIIYMLIPPILRPTSELRNPRTYQCILELCLTTIYILTNKLSKTQ